MTGIEENVSKAGHELKEWQKEDYIQKEALKSMFILNLNKKLNWKQHYEKAGYEFRSRLLVPLLNHLPSDLLRDKNGLQDKDYFSHNPPFSYYGGKK